MPVRWSLREMARAVRYREVSSTELVEAHLDRISAVNPSINAFTTVLAEQAIEQARELDRRPALEPLHGVPVTIKDCFDVAGAPTLCGVRARFGHRAESDSNVAARLRRAGAVFLGKTNVPELVANYETDNAITGRTVNPWNGGRTPGGSSGGEAAAIAAGCSPGGVGSDGGGSIRIPALFCGIAGFKPTHRRIGSGGSFPPSYPPHGIVATPGPMARSVSDLRLLFEILEGVDPRDSLSVPGPARKGPAPRRIGLVKCFGKVPADPALVCALENAASHFAQAGYEIEEVRLEALERAPNVWAFLFGELGAVALREHLRGREAEAHWTVTENLRENPPPDAAAILAQLAERERLRAAAMAVFERFPILLSPPCSVPAFPHRRRRFPIAEREIGLFAATALATTWNLLGFPALTLPHGFTPEGLPAGVQLVGLPFADEEVLAMGEELEQMRGPYPMPAVDTGLSAAPGAAEHKLQ